MSTVANAVGWIAVLLALYATLFFWHQAGRNVAGVQFESAPPHDATSVRTGRYGFVSWIQSLDQVPSLCLLAASLRESGSSPGVDMVLLVTLPAPLPAQTWQLLAQAGWQEHLNVAELAGVPNDMSKLGLWSLVQYDSLVYIEPGGLVLRNIRDLFRMPRFAAANAIALDSTGECGAGFTRQLDTGVLVVRPHAGWAARLRARCLTGAPAEYDERGCINSVFNLTALQLPVEYNAPVLLKTLDRTLWQSLFPHRASIIRFTTDPAMLAQQFGEAAFREELALWHMFTERMPPAG